MYFRCINFYIGQMHIWSFYFTTNTFEESFYTTFNFCI